MGCKATKAVLRAAGLGVDSTSGLMFFIKSH